MASSVRMVAGDTSPVLAATFYSDAAGTVPVDLSGASVALWVRAVDGTVLIDDAPVTVTDAEGGAVSYDWSTAIDRAGAHVGRFVVTFGDGSVGHYPNHGDVRFHVSDGKVL